MREREKSFHLGFIFFFSIYAAPSSSLDGVLDCRRSIAGRDFVRVGDEAFDGGDVARLSRSSKLARALEMNNIVSCLFNEKKEKKNRKVNKQDGILT
jgi:hypothetical protein